MDKLHFTTKKRVMQNNIRSIITISVVSILILIGLYGTYRTLLDNAKNMGLELVRSYAADEERDIATYKTVISLGLSYLDDLEESHMEADDIKNAMVGFMDEARAAVGDDELQIYAIGDGEFIGEDIDIDFMNTSWYKKVLEADGEVVFTDENTYLGTDTRMVIVAAANPDNGDTLLIALKQENFTLNHRDLELPEQGAYYLCDSKGNLLFYKAPFEVDENSIEAYAADLCNKIREGSIAETGDEIIDLNGKSRGLFHNTTSNDWICIMTIPHAVLLAGFYKIMGICCFAFVLYLVMMIILTIRDIMQGRRNVRNSEIIKALSSWYYAFYRINLKNGTYEMIKGSSELRGMIDKTGTYQDMMAGFTEVVDKDTAAELNASFSLEHLRELYSRNVKNYGGDFLRVLDGEKKWVNMSFIIDDNLGKDEAILVFRQINAEKEKQIKHTKLLEDALALADTSGKSQRKFYSRMSHEMRTPMNIILGMNEMAMDDNCPADKRLYYQGKIQETGNELLKLINDMLERSSQGTDSIINEKGTFNICAEVENIIEPFKKQCILEDKKIELKMDVDSEKVIGDYIGLNIILNNLLSNAVQFTNAGDCITVCLKQVGFSNCNYIFTVEDTGIGMSDEFLPKIYEPYSQEKRFGSQVSSGGGLGMTFVKNMVSQNGGDIEIESEVGKGTKVVVTLVYKSEIEDNVLDEGVDDDWMSRLHIMVVDDNDLNRELLSSLLSEQGATVSEAVDGKEALIMFDESEIHDIDVIIMDLNMPVMDGCDSARAIRALDREDAADVFIVALTANDYSEDIVRTAKAGMNAHLSKPVNIKLLKDTIFKLYMKNKKDI